MPDHCESKFVTQSVLLSFLIRKKQTLFLLKVIDARTWIAASRLIGTALSTHIINMNYMLHIHEPAGN